MKKEGKKTSIEKVFLSRPGVKFQGVKGGARGGQGSRQKKMSVRKGGNRVLLPEGCYKVNNGKGPQLKEV